MPWSELPSVQRHSIYTPVTPQPQTPDSISPPASQVILLSQVHEALLRNMADMWEQHKDTIHRLYIAEGLSLDTVIRRMAESHGFNRTKRQYERKLNDWSFRKNLNKKERENIIQQMTKRKRDGKESEVSFNGIILGTKRLKRAEGRLPLSCSLLTTPGNPEASQVAVTTPRSSIPQLSWFGRLPWHQFSDTYLSIPIYPSSTSPTTLSQSQYQVATTPNSVTNNSTIAHQFGHDTPAFIAAQRSMMPEDHDIKHDETVMRLNSDDPSVVESEVFKVLLYQLSNKMQIAQEVADHLNDEAVIRVFMNAGRNNPQWLDSLLSSGEPTVAALVENIFAVAVRRQEIALVSSLLATKLVTPDIPILGRPRDVKFTFFRGLSEIQVSFTSNAYFCSPLQMAISVENVQLARSLIDAGAQVNPGDRGMDLSPLELVSSLASHDKALSLADTLVTHGAVVNRPRDRTRPTALILAVAAGNFKLVEFFVLHDADIMRSYQPESLTGMKIDALQLAVLHGDVRLLDALSMSFKCRMVLPRCNDLMVLAISSRNHEAVRYLKDAGADLNGFCSWGEYPLATAVFVEDMEIVHKLLEWGVCVSDSQSLPTEPFLPVYAAAFKGNVPILKWLISKGASLNPILPPFTPILNRELRSACKTYSNCGNHYNKRLKSPLQVAIHAGHAQAALFILDNGGDCFHGGELVLAARLGSLQLVKALLNKGVCIDDNWNKETALNAALKCGQKHIAHLLIRSGVSITGGEWARALINRDDESAAIIASKAHLRHLMMPGPRRETPLEVAYGTRNLATASDILTKGWAGYDSAALCAVVWNEVQQDSGNFLNHLSPGTVCAALHNDVPWPNSDRKYSCVAPLLQHRLASQTDEFEATALAIAATYKRNDILLVLLQHLKQSSAHAFSVPDVGTPNPDMFWWRRKGLLRKSPLHMAVDILDPSIVRIFLSHRFEPDIQCFLRTLSLPKTEEGQDILLDIWNARAPSSYGLACVGWAFGTVVEARDLQLVKKLIATGLRVDSRINDWRGWTPLQTAVQTGDTEVVKYLIQAGADVNARPAMRRGYTALQIAAMMNNMELVRLLIENGANVNASGATLCGRSAIEGAAGFGRLDMVKLLLAKGVKTEGIWREQLVKAISFAKKQGNYAIARVLESYIN
ncbi:hypothetical protein F5X99DRAFT_394651 [Biscogniauxia marginata]|nr:hypothetical protein F5X99DRAFT_394651 [Biscogniauxia marginata]